MKLQSLTIIFIIIVLPISLVLSAYIGYELKTIEKQNMYNTGVVKATHDAIFSFEINTNSDNYSNNPETKRDIIKSAVKTFENSLGTTCNLSIYGNSIIEEYIPALVFGMYDGFYMYAPYKTKDGYKHELRNYVFYSEQLENTDITIRYSLDNYVAVSGTFKNLTTNKNEYMTKSGYLINQNIWPDLSTIEEDLSYKKYDQNRKTINEVNNHNNKDAQTYYNNAKEFTNWFNSNVTSKITDTELKKDLTISNSNDPDNSNHAFVQHKREIMKKRIQSILNSSITAYANKSGNKYKMPVFSEEDWQKIYNNISIISFVQGMNLGFKNYNSYCILNSTNNNEYVNPNLIYFVNNNEYHDIRCTEIDTSKPIVGYRIGDFEKTKVEVYEDGSADKTKEVYYYKHDETACYGCINGLSDENKNSGKMQINIYNFITKNNVNENLKKAYFSALARERQNTTKLSDRLNITY